MDAQKRKWMNYSIELAEMVIESNLQVGAVLISESNELLCSAYVGEEPNKSCCTALLNKVRRLNISNAQSLFLTINTLSETSSFELHCLLNEIHINEIYIGLPDPQLLSYLDDDPVTNFENVYRYPVDLQRKILQQNKSYFVKSKQSLMHSPYFSENRISDLVIKKLKSKGFIISKEELYANKRKSALASLIRKKYEIEKAEAINVVHNAISEAFSSKYSAYNYADDARSLDLHWKENFIAFYKKTLARPLTAVNILNVGVGSGHEAKALFSNCNYITFVDISHTGLKKIKEQIPLSTIIVSNAEDLSSIPDNKYELYVSLRTYNSSFFDTKKAAFEAHRVLKLNAVIIVSVANGFLCPERFCVIPGLIIPETEFVDIYRGIDTIRTLRTEFLQAGFKNIQLFPTSTEILLSAIKHCP